MTSDQTRAFAARLDRIPIATRAQKLWGLLLGGVFVFELADLNTFGLVAPKLAKQWHLSLDAVSWVTSLAFLGMFFGSIIGGRLSDRFGRKNTLICSTIFFSVFSLLSATAANVATLATYRVLTGAGLTGMTVIALTYVSEMYPKAIRGRYLSGIFGAGLLGIPAISWFARAVVPIGENGWRLVFVVGGLGLLVAAAMVWMLPESVRWLTLNGEVSAAEAQVAGMEAAAIAILGHPLSEPVLEPARAPGRLPDLFVGAQRKRTVVYVAAITLATVGFYGYQALLPTLLVERGFDVIKSLTFTSILQIGAIPGALLAYPIVDRFQRKTLAGLSYFVIAALAAVYGYANSEGSIVTTGFIIAMFLQTSTVFVYAYGPEIFPTELRGLGSGLGNGLGRLATFGSANLLPAIYRTWGYSAVFTYIAVVLVAAGLLFLLFGERTSGRSLEAIERSENERGPAGEALPRAVAQARTTSKSDESAIA